MSSKKHRERNEYLEILYDIISIFIGITSGLIGILFQDYLLVSVSVIATSLALRSVITNSPEK